MTDTNQEPATGSLKVDVGGGKHPEEGHVNVDLREIDEVDHQSPASELPFDDETVSRLVCHSVIPHVEDIPAVFEEFSRVLEPGGELVVSATHAHSTGIVQDPDHNSWSWTARSGEWFDSENEFAYFGNYSLRLVDVDMDMWARPGKWWLRPLAATFNRLPAIFSPEVLDEIMKLPFAAGRVEARFRKP